LINIEKLNFTIMKVKRYFILSLVAFGLTFVSCSSNDEEQTTGSKDIRFSVSWGDAVSRATVTERDIIYPNSVVWAWASMINSADNNPATNTSSYFKAWHLKANADHSLQGVSVTRQFPAVNHLNFYAMHGDFTSGQITENTTAFPTDGLTFQVEPDQSTRDNYYLSDLVYSVYPDVEPTGIDITLPFYHMLSQIRVKLIAGDQLTTSDLAQSNVTLVNAIYRGTFVPSTDASLFATATGRASMVIADNNQRSDITLKNSTTSAFLNSNDYASAVVLPQTYAQGADMIRITLANNHEFVFRPSTALTLGSGKAYEIVITINDGHALGVITQLSDWQATSDEETINFESSI